MPVVRYMKKTGEGTYEVWYDDCTKAVHRVYPETMDVMRRHAGQFRKEDFE